MSNVYKIETQSEVCAGMVEGFIAGMGGKCLVQGSAVITDYPFDSYSALWLLPFISSTNDQITQNDIESWADVN